MLSHLDYSDVLLIGVVSFGHLGEDVRLPRVGPYIGAEASDVTWLRQG